MKKKHQQDCVDTEIDLHTFCEDADAVGIHLQSEIKVMSTSNTLDKRRWDKKY